MTTGLMRHLSRTKAHRDAMFRNLVSQLFQHGSIVSTHEKCLEASRMADRIITMAKDLKKHPNSAKEIQSRLSLAGDNSKLLQRVTGELAPRYRSRPGGYTRVLKLEPRLGDRAKQSVLELVDSPVLGHDGAFQRGNLKLWLLCKNAIASESSNTAYTPLTLRNFAKMLKFKSNRKQFVSELLAVRRFLKDEMSLPWIEAHERKTTSQLLKLATGSALEPPKQVKPLGYVVMEERPQR
ncbi:LADA_0E01354g1_1 [Lachancea dasiensis]|uniref:LADA_0E01354g1_1 n=1 Tax=Lachancea dasiensis TaxID=1072105 RepID=A0A1G4JAI5_9SACH|nr:LADA_0E01354g1_1 [Lachancea dasiensis]